MADVPALTILDEHIDIFHKLPEPPTSDDKFDAFKEKTERCMGTAVKDVEKINKYAENIHDKLKTMKKIIKASLDRIQEAIREELTRLVVVAQQGGSVSPDGSSGVKKDTTPRQQVAGLNTPLARKINTPNTKQRTENQETRKSENLKILDRVQKLEKLALPILNSRLNDLIMETERACAKVKDEGQLTADDLEGLTGCLDSWQKAKKEGYEEEKRRIEEEKKRKEEAASKRKQEEEERKKKEEEERKQREEEERRRKEEEERKRKEEEERKQREEEERKEREEKERNEKEATQKRERADEERRRREEKAALAKEVERQKQEAERRRKLEDEKQRKLDPNNWPPIVYNRSQADEVNGRKPFHNGIGCIIVTPPGGLVKDDIECNASDELDDVIEVLDDGEKAASSVVSVESKKGELNSEVPSRVFIPHCPVSNTSEELVVKASVNGSYWVTSDAIAPGPAITNETNSSNLVGIDLNGLKYAKLMVVARPKGQTVMVDKSGLNVNSITDKNVKVFIPRDAFNERTSVRVVAQPVLMETIKGNEKEGSIMEIVVSTSSMITVSSDTASVKDIEVDIARGSDGTSGNTKMHQLYKTKDNIWKFADAEFKGPDNTMSVKIPAKNKNCDLFELETSTTVTKEKVLKVAESVHAKMFKTPVRIIMKQLDDKPLEAVMMVVRSDLTTKCLQQLRTDGYTRGPDVSKEFGLRDGQKLILTCAGNIGTSTGSSGKLKFIYFTYMNMVKQDLLLHVNDIYKQKDLAEYMGMVKITVDDGTEFPSEAYDLMVTLPKGGKQKKQAAPEQEFQPMSQRYKRQTNLKGRKN